LPIKYLTNYIGVVDLSIDEILYNPEYREVLKRIIRHEEELEEQYRTDPIYQGLDMHPFWELLDIPVEWKYVRVFIHAGLVKKFSKKTYMLINREQIKKKIEEIESQIKERRAAQEREIEFPSDLFDIIEGYDDLKYFLKLALKAERPVHVLLVGAPGTAKTLFLMEIERLGARFITAGTSTKVGIRDIIFEELPRILIIDELDKIADSKDLSALLTWMESGRIIIAKHQLREERRGKGWVIAACNTTRGLPRELLDRFEIFYLKPYSRDDFILVVTNYLSKRMNIDRDLAEYIANKVYSYSNSVREAIRIATLAKTKKDVDKILSIVKKYRP